MCNAGVANVNAPDDWLTVDDYKSTAEVNLHGVIRTCQTFKPLIKKTKGRIVIITSSIGRLALPALGPYAVSKFAAEAYADVLRYSKQLCCDMLEACTVNCFSGLRVRLLDTLCTSWNLVCLKQTCSTCLH